MFSIGWKNKMDEVQTNSGIFTEPSVRAELMEQVPHVAMYCHEEKSEHQWMHLVPSFLLPLVVRYLTDVNNQVRKTAQAALLVLLEQDLVARNDVEDQVCPLLTMLTNADAHDDFRTEAAAVSLLLVSFLKLKFEKYKNKREGSFGVKDMGSEMLVLSSFPHLSLLCRSCCDPYFRQHVLLYNIPRELNRFRAVKVDWEMLFKIHITASFDEPGVLEIISPI